MVIVSWNSISTLYTVKSTHPEINAKRLLGRLKVLGDIGRTRSGGVCRLALTEEDRAGRDCVVAWMREAQLEIRVDQVGNIFGIRGGTLDAAPVMSGSHLDTVRDGGILDGAYGVLAALEIIDALNDARFKTKRPLIVASFTNEEGVRFQSDMMGSLAHAGGISVESVLSTVDSGKVSIRQALHDIGYAGEMDCGTIRPEAFVELHIEQGPVLEQDGVTIGAVENLQGISWSEISISGQSNHAGTTPMRLRHDAGYCAGAITAFLRSLADRLGGSQVATVGQIELNPNVINVIPGSARIMVDLRNTDDAILGQAENALMEFVEDLQTKEGVSISTRTLARFAPVHFSERIARVIEKKAAGQRLSCCRITSGAGHDAQMMSRICDTGMIFVPSENGISHNPGEHTSDIHLVAGASVLLETLLDLSNT